MTTIYEHETGTSRIVAVEQWDGSTDIMISQGMGTVYEDVMRQPLSHNECDKLGAVLCKDIIDNYKGHAADLKDRIAELENIMTDMQYDNIELQRENAELVRTTLGHDKVHASIVAGMQLQLTDLRDIVHERNHFINKTVVEHNDHTHQLCARIEYLEAITKGHDDCKEAFFKLLDQRTELEATNRGLEQDIENLRISNALYRKRWNEHEIVPDMSGFYGMRSQNFERLVKGYRGMLKRTGKIIIITLPFEHENVARNAEKYIVGLED